MQADLLSTVIMPASLAFIMFTLGASLRLADFERVFRYPRAFGVGVVCHFLLLPLVGYLVISAFGLTGAMAVGFMLIAACPTGTTSNILTYHARADVALALSFTAFAGLVAIFTVPLILAWSLTRFMGASAAIDFPYAMVMTNIFLIMGLPVGLGMLLRRQWPVFVARWHAHMSQLATLLFVAILFLTIAKNWSTFTEHGLDLAPLVLSMNAILLALGFFLTRAVGAPLRQAATVAIESSVQNGALAIVIATSLLKNDIIAVPAAVYSIAMYVTGVAFVFVMRRYAPPLSAEEERAAQAAMH